MKKCPVCNHEVKDDDKFCPSCGAQLDNPSKKLSWGEKKKKRELEDISSIDAASLHEEQIKDIPTLALDSIKVTEAGTTKKAFNKNIIITVVTALLILTCLAFVVIFRFMDINQTLKVFLVFLMFMIFASSLAFLTNSIYAIRMLKGMLNSDFAIKKIEYGKPPYMSINGKLYTLSITAYCSMCSTPCGMHIEELNGKFVAVCDNNRLHLLLIDTVTLKEKLTTNKE